MTSSTASFVIASFFASKPATAARRSFPISGTSEAMTSLSASASSSRTFVVTSDVLGCSVDEDRVDDVFVNCFSELFFLLKSPVVANKTREKDLQVAPVLVFSKIEVSVIEKTY